MTRGTKDPIDAHVGQRIKMQRGLLGWSQDKLAQAIGVSFQQVQKYENGANRVGASRLMILAQAMAVPVAFFFEGFGGAAGLPMVAEDKKAIDNSVFEKKETLDLIKAYYALPEQTRKNFLTMLKGLGTPTKEEE